MPRFVVCVLALLCFAVFYKLKVCGNPVSSRSIGAIFPTALAHFVSLSHSGNSRHFSDFFIIIVFVTVISDL